MARLKARVEFLLSVIELFSYLTIKALQGKMSKLGRDKYRKLPKATESYRK